MGIEAYLDVEEEQSEETKELEELSPEAYKGLVQQINIDKAEQSIIEEVVGVDGDDDENEEEELRDEREMKNLFEQLYEIDPDTKEVFVKGSAYDLKKWDEDMVCFTFGDPERVIALEAAISPGERYLSRCFDKLSMKHTQLAEIMRRHSNELRAKTISQSRYHHIITNTQLLANPTSWNQITNSNPNLNQFLKFTSYHQITTLYTNHYNTYITPNIKTILI